MRVSEQPVQELLKNWIPRATPGLQVQAYHKGKKILDVEEGKTHRFYDWASLTKIVFSASALMLLQDRKKFLLSQDIREFLPWIPSSVRIDRLLSHTGGSPWWQPYYKKIDRDLMPGHRWFQLSVLLQDVKLKKTSTAVYSDIDLFFLGFLMEELFEKSLFSIWEKDLYPLFGLKSTHFVREGFPRLFPRSQYAPTEKCPWRKKIVQGEVHDENTWALGGVAPHAGLFGTIDDLGKWGLWLRKGFRGESRFPIRHSVIQRFTRRAVPLSKGSWGLGFMLPTPGSASCGQYFSPQSFGHLGFPGTSLWYDPRADLLVVILSNRTFPNRNNIEIRKLRPLLHDVIYGLVHE